MNSVRRLIPLTQQRQMFLGKRFYSDSKELSEEEKTKLYEKLMKFNEKNLEASSFTKFITPHYKFGPPRLMNYDWSIKSMVNWFKFQRIKFHKYNQRYMTDRVKALGSDLGAAHFVVYRGGAIRFRGQDEFIRWTNSKEQYDANLPKTYNPKYFVEAIDVSNMMIHYQGLENFKNLYKLKWLNLSNNNVLDNWCLDYIGHKIPSLEYLNISNCSQITSGGIAGLQNLTQLKVLVINSTNVEIRMACFALEDIIPGLFVLIEDNNDIKLLTKDDKFNVNELK